MNDLYEFLKERFLWTEEEDRKPMTEEEASKLIGWWKEDYEADEYLPINPNTVNAKEVANTWNYIIEWEA